jgi:hypothetical protein
MRENQVLRNRITDLQQENDDTKDRLREHREERALLLRNNEDNEDRI